MVSEKIFEKKKKKKTHTHTFLHTRTQQLRVVPDERVLGALTAKHYCIFVGFGGAVFFFQSSGQLVFVKMYNFLQVMVRLKNAVCSNGICWNEKKSFYF